MSSKRQRSSKAKKNITGEHDEKSNMSLDRSKNLLPVTPHSHRNIMAEDSIRVDNLNRFMMESVANATPRKVEFDPPSLELHGGWLYPERHYENIPPENMTESELEERKRQGSRYEEEEQTADDDQQMRSRRSSKVNAEDEKMQTRRPCCHHCCCCCCMRRQMYFYACCPCAQRYQRYTPNQTYEYRTQKPSDKRRLQKNGYNGVKDSDLASVSVNKADVEFGKGIKEKQDSSQRGPSRQRKRSKSRKRLKSRQRPSEDK